jgi:uncharacterized protein YycO
MLTYKVGIMIRLFSLLLLLQSLGAVAQTGLVLRPGDVLLQPLKCWTCSLIEAEEETIYSHIGVVLSVEPEVLVAEAFGKVRKVSLSEFNSKTEPGQMLMVLRFRNEKLSEVFQNAPEDFSKLFDEEFNGKKYDHDFRWNNFDEAGDQKYYCSELVSKLFQAFVGIDTPIKRMHFQKNRDYWVKYFKGNVPDNEWGNSPGDYERSDMFYHAGEL